MGAGIWFVFMLVLFVGMVVWVDDIPKDTRLLEHADIRYARVKQGLAVLAVIGVLTIPLFSWLFD